MKLEPVASGHNSLSQDGLYSIRIRGLVLTLYDTDLAVTVLYSYLPIAECFNFYGASTRESSMSLEGEEGKDGEIRYRV